jgi:hypothetical protein
MGMEDTARASMHCGALVKPREMGATLADLVKGPSEMDTARFVTRPKYYGVGGWLLVFLFGVLVFQPVYYFRHVLRIVSRLRSPFGGVDVGYGEKLSYLIQENIHIAIVVYGMFAGIQLCRIRPRAVTHAKRF